MIKNVPQYIEERRFAEWEVRVNPKDVNSVSFATNDNLTFEENLAAYRAWEQNAVGSYFIIGKPTKGSTKNNATESFSLHGAEPEAQRTASVPAVGAVPEGYVSERELGQRLENLRLSYKIERMEERQKELEEKASEADSATNKFMAAVTPYVGAMLAGLFPQAAQAVAPAQVAVAGMDDERMDMRHPISPKQDEDDDNEYIDLHGLTPDEADRLLAIGTRLKQAEPQEWLQMLGKIADMAEAKDQTYMLARGVLTAK